MYKGLSTPCVQESFYFSAVYPDHLRPLQQPPVVGHQETTLRLLQFHPVISLVMASPATPRAHRGILIIFIFYIIPIIVILIPFLMLLGMSSLSEARPSLALSGWLVKCWLSLGLQGADISHHSFLQLFICVWFQLPHPVL